MSSDAAIPLQFFGWEHYTLDEKGRVTVPFDWRRPDGEPDVFYLVPDSKGECLRAMRHERYAKFAADARNLPGMDAQKHRMFMRNFFAQCAKTTTDKQGRITIPKASCERFHLKGEIALHGTGDLFEIWNKSAHATRQKREAADFAKIAGEMGL
jgi:division/cell wall cluster transcriptional repressor MraZ